MLARTAGQFLQAKRLLQIELSLSAEPTVKDEHAARRQQSDVVRNGRSRDRIDDDVNAALVIRSPIFSVLRLMT